MTSLLLIALLLLSVLLCCSVTKAQTNGDIQLVSDHTNDSSSLIIGGRVEVFINNNWGTVCSDNFGRIEANVICNQLGYVGAVFYGNSRALGYTYGSVSQSIVMDDVNCTEGTKHILSCKYKVTSNCNHFEDIAVKCNSTALWSVNPYRGMIRLTGGRYSSEGLLEVYCNDQWGTVCDDLFETTEATTACKQLGYTHSINGRLVGLIGNLSQPIWLDNVQCTMIDSCISSCKRCPTKEDHDCTHAEDVSIRCTYQTTQQSSSFASCQYTIKSDANISSGAIVAIIVTCILMMCCCMGLVFVLIASISIAQKKRKSSTKTEETSLDDMSSIDKSTQLFAPPSTVLQQSVELPDRTYEEPIEPAVLYETIPGEEGGVLSNYRNTVVYDSTPTNGEEDRPIYIQPPATTPSSEYPPPFPPPY